MVAYERLTEFSNLPAFLDLNGSESSAMCKKFETGFREQIFFKTRNCFSQILSLIKGLKIKKIILRRYVLRKTTRQRES